MRKFRIFQSTVFRLAAVYVPLFAISVAALGAVTYFATSAVLQYRLNANIARQTAALSSIYRSRGIPGLVANIGAPGEARRSPQLYSLVVNSKGEPLKGYLPVSVPHAGWSDVDYVESESDHDMGRIRVLVTPLAGGLRLAVAADLEQVEEMQTIILGAFLSAFGAVILLGTAGGIVLGFALLKRVEAIRRTAEAIIAGDFSQRIPLHGRGDDLDRLSQTLNHMLDRMAELMESLRQVSADIAHDLKTPLARLRQRLETLQGHALSTDVCPREVEAAVAMVDEILATFGALLRIAQVEAGTRRAGFREVDLSGVFSTVFETFAPVAEDAGQIVEAAIAADIVVLGDRELLTQMVVNLVENAIRHTPAGTRIAISLWRERDEIIASITDNGPGVPDEERERLFQRLYRLERSRSTPGSGLGLSLAKAVADLHEIALDLRNARPGLSVVLRFRS